MKGAALPANWCASREEIEYGLELGFTEREILNCAEDMRLWAEANSNRAVARKANWRATFKGWLRREAGKRGLFRRQEQDLSYMDIAEELRRDGNRAGGNEHSQTPDLFAAGHKP